MTEVLTPDLCVIGAGSGGLSVVAAAAAFGAPVVLVEKAAMGGECLNSGCVPAKALLAAAHRAAVFRHAAPFGLGDRPAAVDFARVHDHVNRVIGAIAPNDSVERFTGLGARVILGTAALTDPDLLRRALDAHGPERVLVSVDARDGRVATAGWTQTTELTPVEAVQRLQARGVAGLVYTNVDRDGMLDGPDLDGVRAVAAAVRPPAT